LAFHPFVKVDDFAEEAAKPIQRSPEKAICSTK
jgi:hypothetical protein